MIQQISGYRIKVANLTTVQVEKWDSNHVSQGQPSGKLRYKTKKNALAPLLEAQRNYENNPKTVQKLGEMLFEVLFDDTLRNDFVLFYNEVVQIQKQILRIELDIDEQSLPEIAALPWEFMRVPQSARIGTILLGTVPDVSLSRRRTLWIEAQPIQLGAGEKLRIALVVSAPENVGPVDYAKLEENLKELATNFPGKLELLPISQGNPEAIDEVLAKKPHILHFVGHGRAKNDEDEEVEELALTNPDLGDAIWVGADFFSQLLNTHKPALVMLQACDSGTLSRKQPFFGVASRIVQQNIPVVVAMQYEVSNATANRFSQKFYEEILKGKPVDIAAQFGRRQISLEPNLLFNRRDFATPVIFMRVEDGNLFANIPTEVKKSTIETKVLQRRLEGAMPKQSAVNRKTEIRAMVVLPNSPGLKEYLPDFTAAGDEIAKADVQKNSIPLEFPLSETKELQPTTVYMSLEAADFEIDNSMIDQLVYPENDSGVVTFFLTPKKAQKRAWVVIHVFKDEQRSKQLGSLGLNTEVKGEGELITDRSWQLQTSAKITEIRGFSASEIVGYGGNIFAGNVDFIVGESVRYSPINPWDFHPDSEGVPDGVIFDETQGSSPSPPTRRPKLKGLEIGALRGIILDAFTEDQLRLLLTLRLDITYDEINEGSSYDIKIFNLITRYFEPRGETANLVLALLQERPNNQDLMSFYTSYYQ